MPSAPVCNSYQAKKTLMNNTCSGRLNESRFADIHTKSERDPARGSVLYEFSSSVIVRVTARVYKIFSWLQVLKREKYYFGGFRLTT
jgi:hypothetical protein